MKRPVEISPILAYHGMREIDEKADFMLSRVTTKGQVTIPKPIRAALGIGPGYKVAFIREGERVLIQPLRTLKAFRGAVKGKGSGSFAEERSRAKAAVAASVVLQHCLYNNDKLRNDKGVKL